MTLGYVKSLTFNKLLNVCERTLDQKSRKTFLSKTNKGNKLVSVLEIKEIADINHKSVFLPWEQASNELVSLLEDEFIVINCYLVRCSAETMASM